MELLPKEVPLVMRAVVDGEILPGHRKANNEDFPEIYILNEPEGELLFTITGFQAAEVDMSDDSVTVLTFQGRTVRLEECHVEYYDGTPEAILIPLQSVATN